MTESIPPVPMELEKFTTRYNAPQDRLCIDGQSAGGEIVCLWLTQRLLRQLLPMLLQLVTPTSETKEKTSILAKWALTTAEAAKRPAKAVALRGGHTPGTDGPLPSSWLVRSIELKSSPNGVLLAFALFPKQIVAVLAFNPVHLRQWLGILYRLWKRAGWSEDQWPAWVRETEMPTRSTDVLLH